MVLSIALVVAVLIGFLAMAAGLERTLGAGGADDVAIVLGGGTSQEIASSVPPEAARTLQAAGKTAGIATDPSGRPMLSRELVVPVEATAADGSVRTISFRGMEAAGPTLRGGVAIADGRPFAPGSREILIGRSLARDLGIAAPGAPLRLGPVDWTIAGLVSARGGAAESEIWGDLDAVRAAFDRQGEIQSLRVRLAGPDGLAALRKALGGAATTPLDAMTEADFLGRQSAPVTRLVTLFGWPIALLMAIGASAGALNTMMSSVADRRAEIATLRVLGFSRGAAITATLAEAIVLSLAGALLGAAGCTLLLDGWHASTLGAGGTAIAFQLAVTPGVLVQADLIALLIGAVGGALPALAATRLPLVEALKAGA